MSEAEKELFARLEKLEQEVEDVRDGYVALSSRHGMVLNSLKVFTEQSMTAALLAASAAEKSKHAAIRARDTAKSAADNHMLAVAEIAAEAALASAQAASDAAASAAAASAAASTAAAHHAEELSLHAAKDAAKAVSVAAHAAANAVKASSEAAEFAKRPRPFDGKGDGKTT